MGQAPLPVRRTEEHLYRSRLRLACLTRSRRRWFVRANAIACGFGLNENVSKLAGRGIISRYLAWYGFRIIGAMYSLEK